METVAFDKSTFGLQWKPPVLEPWQGATRRGAFPEYFRQEGKEWVAVAADAVPEETGLKAATFPPAPADRSYTSPESGEHSWRTPAPKAGPFEAKLSDGSVVTY